MSTFYLLEAQRAKLTDDFLVMMNFVYPYNEIEIEYEWVKVDGQTICKYDFPERAKELARPLFVNALDVEAKAYSYYHEIFKQRGLKILKSKEEFELRMKQLKSDPHFGQREAFQCRRYVEHRKRGREKVSGVGGSG